jgi:glutathione-regulated potassium-efflux system ancillary protein KefG
MARILVLFAHPALEKSRVQLQLLKAAKSVMGVTIHDLYESYPDMDIDVEREQSQLTKHDIILLQHPLYWYSAPAIVKQWLDLVLEHGWAYGSGGTALQGKRMGNVLSAGGSMDAYSPEGRNKYYLKDMLIPFRQTATLCGMEYLPPFVVHGTHRISNDDIRQQADFYRAVLQQMAENAFPFEAIAQSNYLNQSPPQ